jgi:hypothetical protein
MTPAEANASAGRHDEHDAPQPVYLTVATVPVRNVPPVTPMILISRHHTKKGAATSRQDVRCSGRHSTCRLDRGRSVLVAAMNALARRRAGRRVEGARAGVMASSRTAGVGTTDRDLVDPGGCVGPAAAPSSPKSAGGRPCPGARNPPGCLRIPALGVVLMMPRIGRLGAEPGRPHASCVV